MSEMEDFDSPPRTFRPHSLSIVTLTSDIEDRTFENNEIRLRNPSISTLSELMHDFYAPNMEIIEEMASSGGSRGTPTFVIDEVGSVHKDTYNDVNNNNDDNRSVKSVKINNNFIRDDIKQGNFDNPLIKYLLEPPTHRKVKNGSVSSSVSGRNPASILKQSVSRDDINDDNMSIGGCSIGNVADVHSHSNHSDGMNSRLIKVLSIMYAVFIIMVGGIIAISDIESPVNDWDHLFSIILTLIGMIWIGFVHWDIQKYKKWALEYLKPDKPFMKDTSSSKSVVSDYDGISMTTAVIFNTYNHPIDKTDPETEKVLSAYRFSHGKHSGNFYLKCGMTLFCMGSIIHQGVNFAQQVHYFSVGNEQCSNIISLLVYLIRNISAFYQLYIAFKYSNILINRYKTIARFALMHLVGTSISFWFSTIIEEAIEGYVSKIKAMNGTTNYTSIGENVVFRTAVQHHMYCSENALSNTEAMETLPYLYPFSIEYNIILASVWYMIWTNIGENDMSAQSHYVRREVREDASGTVEVNYTSSLSINADCHASNYGLFGGLLTLLLILTTIVIFFTTIKQKEYSDVGVGIYTVQFGVLTLFSAITIPMAYRKIKQLDIVSHHHLDNSATAMDDFLVLIPLPFYYIHNILSIRAEAENISTNSVLLILIYIVNIIQVTIQTPFLVDGIRRCSNNKRLRFSKPGKGLITFILILNIAVWILVTFEIKSVDKYHAMQEFYGKFIWMIILDTCLPLMLFYRFHSSVCLSDIWKHAYEKDEDHFH